MPVTVLPLIVPPRPKMFDVGLTALTPAGHDV